MPHFIAAAIAAAKLFERQCPKCRQKQACALAQRHATIACKHCGEPIPPKQS